VVELDLPRTRENRDAGNFMLEVTMYAADERKSSSVDSILDAARLAMTPTSMRDDAGTVLAISRRPAIVPYRSWIVDHIYTAKSLPWYFFNLREEKDKLRVPIFEKVSFGKGRAGLPAMLHLEVQSTHRLQIYSAVAHFRARFTGFEMDHVQSSDHLCCIVHYGFLGHGDVVLRLGLGDCVFLPVVAKAERTVRNAIRQDTNKDQSRGGGRCKSCNVGN